jgi:diguanylate cyclase (GGDEF)-like protein
VLGGIALPSLGVAWGQAQSSTPAGAPWAIKLTSQQPVVSLDRRSRSWIDGSGAATPDQVEAAGEALPWAVRHPGTTYNLDGGKALWLQFDVAVGAGQHWFVELESSGIDRAQLLYRGSDPRWVIQEAGDSKPVSQWPIPGRFPTFELAPAGAEPVRHWLRIEHERVGFASPIALYDQAALFASREQELLLLGGYFGLALLIALIASANAVIHRDRNFGVYAVYVTALAAGQVAYLGIGAQHLWNDWLEWNKMATFALPGISAAAALWFARTITEPARFSKALDLIVLGLIATLLGAVALDALLESRGSFGLMMALNLLALVVVAGLIALVWKQGDDLHIRIIALGFLPVMVAAVFPIARGLNLIPAGALTRYALTAGAALEMPILFYALSLRGSRRRESQVRAAALGGEDALTGLAHGRTLLQRLANAIERARSLKHPCALLAVKIANFDAIASEFGREAAERTLVVAASLLRRAVTDMDLAARVGERDFALLLEGPTSTQIAMSRAQQVIAAGLRTHEALPPGTTLKFHIALALLPESGLDAAASSKWLRDSVNAMDPATRKPIRPVNF